MPNIFFKRLEPKLTARMEPMIEPIIPKMMRVFNTFFSMLPCLIWVYKATMDVGTKIRRLVLCAICCFTFKNIIRAGIKIVPPPIPIPLIIPEIKLIIKIIT